MDVSEVWQALAQPEGGTIVYLVMDGLGGLPDAKHGGTELQVAQIPNFDDLAARSSCGLLEIVGPGITPGSGPGHLALFGYDPLTYSVGRGVLAALGIDFDLQEGDVAARVNFATLDAHGNIADRRAGRIDTRTNQRLCQQITQAVNLSFGGDYFFETVSEHRAVLILRGDGLSDAIGDTDPQRTGTPPLAPEPHTDEAEHTAQIVRSFVKQVHDVLADEPEANGVLLRGFEQYHPIPTLSERFHLSGICLADYPMYRGVSRLLGMHVPPPPGGLEDRVEALRACYGEMYNFYFLHVKKTDSLGEDGDFDAKVRSIEAVDRLLPHLLELEPDVLVVTADHSTPAAMARHSWHPVPTLLHARTARVDDVTTFDEVACMRGALGLRPGVHLMGLALAHAGRLAKYGA
jgi:2,3-bisphosphoglycerate-independent phosphoglycerate mutase